MSLIDLSVRRTAFITSIVLVLLIVGYLSLQRMKVDLFPDVTFPVVIVQVIYPGASPADMESLVAKPIEDELGSLSGLEKMRSLNSESLSLLIFQFKMGTDIKDSENQIRQRLSNIRSQLPSEIQEPIIRRIDPADQPVAQLAFVSSLPPAQAYDLAKESIKAKFETLAGVGQVDLVGGRKQEVKAFLDLNKLNFYKISALQIADRLAKGSKNIPLGSYDNGQQDFIYRGLGEFASLADLKSVTVNFWGSDQIVSLADLAQVTFGLAKEDTFSRVRTWASQWKEQTPILFLIYKQSDGNTVQVVEAVKRKVQELNQEWNQAGKGYSLAWVRDGAWPIKANIDDVRESIFIGIVLCIVVVFLFLANFRSTIITALALPNSLLGAFILMYIFGFSINVLTLLALSLAVGLLIDDAIVVRENIFRYLEMGQKPLQAALIGTKEVVLAVLATTAVVIAVFGPIGFLQGIVGQFFKQFGLTVVFAMIISTFDALTVAPMLSAYWASVTHEKGNPWIHKILDAFNAMQSSLEKIYVQALAWVLEHRGRVVFLAVVIFFSSFAMLPWIPKTFLPQADTGEFLVTLELPLGSSLQSSKKVATDIENILIQDPAVELLSTQLGSSGTSRGPHLGSIYIKLRPVQERPGRVKTLEVKERLRPKLQAWSKEHAGILVQIAEFNPVGTTDKPIQLQLLGDDLDQLMGYGEKLKQRLVQIPGFVDVDTNFRLGRPEWQVVFDRRQSEKLGVSLLTAQSELRTYFEGQKVASFKQNNFEYDIKLELVPEQKDLQRYWSQYFVPNTNFQAIPLKSIATLKEASGYSQISRFNKQRFVQIDGNIGSSGALGEIAAEIEKIIQNEPEYKLPQGISYRFEGQVQDMRDLFSSMVLALGLGVILIYFVLASLYESFVTPVTILVALPLAVTGAFAALLITQKSLDIFSMIGFVMLLGVVAKNSILLVDFAQRKIYEGLDQKTALLQAGQTRLRPILMTSLALIGGVLPIAIGLNEASQQRTSMGVVVIGGLISSTLLSLVVVPAIFGYVEDMRLWWRRVFKLDSGDIHEQQA